MKLYDLEVHFFTEHYIAYLRKNDETPRMETISLGKEQAERLLLGEGLWALRQATLQSLLKMAREGRGDADERHDIVRVLSLAGPGCELFKPSEATPLVREINDELAEIVRSRPGRLRGFAALAPQDPEKAASELDRAVTKLGFVGAKVNSHVRGGEYLDDRKYWPVFEAADGLGVPIYIHPRPPSPQMVKPYADYGYRLAGPALGFAAETALHAMRLIYSGLFDTYPRLKIILGHLGEGLPFFLHRTNHLWESEEGGAVLDLARPPSEYIKENFLVTTSGMCFMPAFLCTYMALGAESILFASDYPFEKTDEAIRFIEHAPLCDADKRKICYGNAESLFREETTLQS